MIRYSIIMYLLVLVFYLVIVECKPSPSTLKNHQLLTQIGLTRIRAPNNHHRKRLAVESRHHSRSDDSHMFIIKLPPNQHYYAHNKPNSIQEPDSKKVPVGFKSNGKPAKIYHWNIPVLKKIVAAKNKSRLNDNNIMDIYSPSIWNEVLDKPHQEKKPLKSSYYVPAKPKKAQVLKYFPGNGKPSSFYVIEKSKKAHYHRLLP